MANSGETPNPGKLSISEDEDDIWASPSKKSRNVETEANSKIHNGNVRESRYGNQDAREQVLQKELQSVRNINQVVEGVIESLDRAKSNMETVSRTVHSASTLLNTWTRILSQTEHNQRLILNPSWQGANQDIADMENEAVMRQQVAERREMEEQQRREAAARKAEEDEKRRSEAANARGSRGSRSRGRGVGRGTSSSSTNYVGVGGQGGVRGTSRGSSTGGTRRVTPGSGKGSGGARGRSRG